MFENLNRFCVRYVKIARNGYLFNKYEKEMRKKMLDLKYELAELEEFYNEKEQEKKTKLKASIEELQEKNNNLQKVYDEEKEKFDKDLEYTLECKKRHYEIISNQLVIDIQDLSSEKAALERTIEKLRRNIPRLKKTQSRAKGIFRRLYKSIIRANRT